MLRTINFYVKLTYMLSHISMLIICRIYGMEENIMATHFMDVSDEREMRTHSSFVRIPLLTQIKGEVNNTL